MSTVRFTVSKAGEKESSSSPSDVQVHIIEPDVTNDCDKENGDKTLLPFKTGNLALYEDEIQRRPKISTLLSSFSRYQAVPVAPSEVEEGVTALKRPQGSKMGTLMGVYLPTIQNIFGVILFIRLSWIVGIAGVGESFMIVATCCCCTMLTAISMSAIATNGVVPAGGSYFMISRSLGPEFGGAVGLLFYLGTTFAISMYVLGAVEIILTYMAPEMSMFGDIHSGNGSQSIMLNNMRVYGTLLLAFLFGIVLVGVKYVNKCASVFLACVLLSILAIYVGFFTIHARESTKICFMDNKLLAKHSYEICSKNDSLLQSTYGDTNYWNDSSVTYIDGIPGITSGILIENVRSFYLKAGEINPGKEADKTNSEVKSDSNTSFFILLAIFFPSVTGIMAGSNRSGDLKDASKSIPKGTIAAIITTSTVYLSSIVFFGATVHGALLRDKFGESIGSELLVSKIAWPHPWVILIGSCMSTVGAGMQSMTGAPRLLQAIARDDILPFLRTFGHGSKSGEPTRALILTVCIAEIGVLIANFDSVAPIITMFFLMCYGFVNLACVLQSLLKSPNWRPRFKYYHWITSALGLCLCLGMMFISSWYYALAAIFLAAAVYKYIEFQGAEKEWGDGIAGLALSAASMSIQRLEEGPQHTKNWRPQILVLCKLNKDLTLRVQRLLTFVGQLKHGRGLTMVGTVIHGEYFDKTQDVQAAKETIRTCMVEEKVKGFAKVVASHDVSEGLSFLIQSGGLGGLTPNTVMLAWPENWREEETWSSFVHTVRVVSAGQEALLVPRNGHLFPDRSERLQGHMDVWWVVHDGGMMILLVFLLHQHKVWRRCRLRIFTVAQLEDNSIQMKNDLKMFMYHLRINADVEVIEMYDSDISEYTYERTLVMEQRSEMLKKMRLTKKESKLEVQGIIESSHRPRTMSTLSQASHTQSYNQEVADEEDCLDNVEEEDVNDVGDRKPNEDNVRRMNTAVRLNNVIREKSAGSELIVVNLPGPPKSIEEDENYMEFIEVLTEGLHRVLMVRGGGGEVVTIYS